MSDSIESLQVPSDPLPQRSPPRLLTLILLTGLSVLSLNMFLPSLKQIATGYGADYALVSLSIGGYLAVSAVLQLIMGPLSDILGRRPVILAGLAVFVLASIGCWLAQDIWTFLAFRMLQGAVICGMVLSRAIIRDMAPASEAARLLGLVGMAMALAPLLGPVLGGVLDELMGWRANFAAFALMGAAMLLIAWRDLGETNLTPSDSFTAQFRSYPALVRSSLFWAYTACLVFSIGGFYAFLGGAPQVGEAVFGLGPAMLGVGMGSISAGFMLGNYMAGRLTPRYGIVPVVTWGRVLACLGPLLGFAAFAAGAEHAAWLFGAAMFIGVGNGLTLPGANAGVMSVDARLAGSASGLSGALTVAGGAVITGATGAAVTGAHGVYALFAMMLATSALGLVAALVVARIERRAPVTMAPPV